jgi:mono/diheme cytochrome c family protein
MFEAVYRALAAVGFFDPVHAAFVHMPIGLVVGAFAFGLSALLIRSSTLHLTSRHCIVLALCFWFPVVAAGIMDWQLFYGGAWLFPFKVKLVFAGILLVLLLAAVLVGRAREGSSKILVMIFMLSFFTVMVLGYFGGRLTFSGKVPSAPAEYSAGRWTFRERCSACHPNGGNIVRSDMPLRGAPMLTNLTIFSAWIRNPSPPMPAFPPSKMTDQQARELYDYVAQTMR